MANLTPSFRFPASLPADAGDKRVLDALTQHSNGLVDVNAAIVALNLKVGTIAPAAPTGTGSPTGTTTVVETGVTSFNEETGGVVYFPSLGIVNNQTGAAAYVTQTQDNGALIVLSNAGAIAVSLNFTVAAPWFTTIANQGSGTATLTPTQGTINGAGTFTIAGGTFAGIYFDGANWWAFEPPSGGGGGVSQIVAGTNVTISPSGGTGAVTINATGSGGGTISAVNAGTGLTGGGSSGSVTLALVTPVSVANGGTGTATPSLVAGTGITITGSFPNQTVAATGGGGGYSLGGSVTTANVSLGAGAGSGASIASVAGLDGTHTVIINLGSSPSNASPIFTLTFSASRGHVTYPVANAFPSTTGGSASIVPFCTGSSSTSYSLWSVTTPTAGVQYNFVVSAP